MEPAFLKEEGKEAEGEDNGELKDITDRCVAMIQKVNVSLHEIIKENRRYQMTRMGAFEQEDYIKKGFANQFKEHIKEQE